MARRHWGSMKYPLPRPFKAYAVSQNRPRLSLWELSSVCSVAEGSVSLRHKRDLITGSWGQLLLEGPARQMAVQTGSAGVCRSRWQLANEKKMLFWPSARRAADP